MDRFSEKPLFDHVHDSQFVIAVIAVFKHHAVTLSLLRSIDQFPAVGNSPGGGNLKHHMFAVLHGMDGDGDVQIGRRSDIHEINIVPLADFFQSSGPVK